MARPLIVDGRNFLDPEALRRGRLRVRGHRQAHRPRRPRQLQRSRTVQAIVLVGGEGTRLRPLTSDVPKPALTLVDRPFLAYMIEWLAGARGDRGRARLRLPARRPARGARRRASTAGCGSPTWPSPSRAAPPGAIRFAADALGDDLDDRFLALNGDVLTDLDLTALMRAHEEREARATHRPLPGRGLRRLRPGRLSTTTARVTEFLEKTGEAVPGEINAGAYVLERSVLDLIPPGREVSIEREVFPRLVGDGLCALRLDGYWMDIGTPERYLQASWDILEGRVATRVRPTAPGLLVGAGSEIAAGATVGPARGRLAAGCRIAAGAEVRDSVLLDGCRRRRGRRVSGSSWRRGRYRRGRGRACRRRHRPG